MIAPGESCGSDHQCCVGAGSGYLIDLHDRLTHRLCLDTANQEVPASQRFAGLADQLASFAGFEIGAFAG